MHLTMLFLMLAGAEASSAFASHRALSPRELSSSAVCDVLEPLLPSSLGCSCAAATSGVGGTATCSRVIPSVTLVSATYVTSAVATPSVTFTMGTEILPCDASGASAKLHATVTLESGWDWPTAAVALDNGGSLKVSGNDFKIERSVQSGQTVTQPISIYAVYGNGLIANVHIEL